MRSGSGFARFDHAIDDQAPSTTFGSSTSASPLPEASGFPTHLFAALGEEPVSNELATELQQVLESSANGDGLTATLITPVGSWSGATGMATAERAMVQNDQMALGSTTKTLVAAQVMQLVETGELRLEDLAA